MKNKRKELDLTQKQFAKVLGYSRAETISEKENGIIGITNQDEIILWYVNRLVVEIQSFIDNELKDLFIVTDGFYSHEVDSELNKLLSHVDYNVQICDLIPLLYATDFGNLKEEIKKSIAILIGEKAVEKSLFRDVILEHYSFDLR